MSGRVVAFAYRDITYLQTLMRDCWTELPADRPTFGEVEQRLRSGGADVRGGFHLNNLHRHRRASAALDDIFPPFIAKALAEGRPVRTAPRFCPCVCYPCVSIFGQEVSVDYVHRICVCCPTSHGLSSSSHRARAYVCECEYVCVRARVYLCMYDDARVLGRCYCACD